MVNFTKYSDIIVIAFLSILVGMFVAQEWINPIINTISSYLFDLFLPGISVVILLFGGVHDASEIHVVLGVLVQSLVLWILLKLIYKKALLKKDDKY